MELFPAQHSKPLIAVATMLDGESSAAVVHSVLAFLLHKH